MRQQTVGDGTVSEKKTWLQERRGTQWVPYISDGFPYTALYPADHMATAKRSMVQLS